MNRVPLEPLWILLAAATALPAASPSSRFSPPSPAIDAADPGDAEVPVEAILTRARGAQQEDIDSWARHRFRRHVTRQRLDASGESTDIDVTESVVTPDTAGMRFDELLVMIDGRTPTPREIEKHRREAPFSRRYATLLRGDGDEDDAGYSLSYLLEMSSYRYIGPETVDGVACHRVAFGPAPEEGNRGDAGIASRFARVMSGTLWIDEEGAHIVKATAGSVGPVNVNLAIVRVEELQLDLTATPVGGGWLPGFIEVRTVVRVLGIPFRRRIVYTYADFVPAPEPPRGTGAR